jgi:hypothetical protein
MDESGKQTWKVDADSAFEVHEFKEQKERELEKIKAEFTKELEKMVVALKDAAGVPEDVNVKFVGRYFVEI